MNNSKILHISYALGITIFLSFFILQTLFYFEISKEITAVICSIVSAAGIILSVFYTKTSISISLMLNSIIMAIYIAFLYWERFSKGYKFFAALALLSILLYSLYTIIKNERK